MVSQLYDYDRDRCGERPVSVILGVRHSGLDHSRMLIPVKISEGEFTVSCYNLLCTGLVHVSDTEHFPKHSQPPCSVLLLCTDLVHTLTCNTERLPKYSQPRYSVLLLRTGLVHTATCNTERLPKHSQPPYIVLLLCTGLVHTVTRNTEPLPKHSWPPYIMRLPSHPSEIEQVLSDKGGIQRFYLITMSSERYCSHCHRG